jgi:superoxide dismutase, Fe-Mn family
MSELRMALRDVLMTLALAAGCHAVKTTAPAVQAVTAAKADAVRPETNQREAISMGTKALNADHTAQPLPFDPAKLTGLSERMIRSHHENNYGAAVKNLNRVEQELATTTKDTPPFVVTALRDRELTFRGSKLLHEQYFGNLGGDGKRAGEIERAPSEAYGSSARWEEHFRATGAGLGGGSGWAILGYELDTGALRTISAASHKESLALFAPLLVMDMYEHSYQMDYGAAVAKYIDAFFANIRWEVVDQRLARARKLRTALAHDGVER